MRATANIELSSMWNSYQNAALFHQKKEKKTPLKHNN